MTTSRRSFVGFIAAVVVVITLGLSPRARADGGLTFELYEDAPSAYRWRLADGHEILATAGQSYRAKADAKASIERVRNELGRLAFETYTDASQAYRWRLKSPNGQIVAASSTAYDTKADAEAAILLVRDGAKDAAVVDRASTK